MIDYRNLEMQLSANLGLEHRPIAVAFRDTPPSGVTKFVGTEPSGCSFWRLASAGKTFYTVPSDHYNCPIGSYTHNISLPPDRVLELEQTLGFMTSIGYIRMEEVPGIPRLSAAPGAVIYAPLGDTPIDPDVALFWGRPGTIMRLQEAAIRAGVPSPLPALGRPTCMAIPAALASGMVATTGCIGNRVYTGIDDSELYLAIPGKDLNRVAAQTETIRSANLALSEYHTNRRQTLATE